MKPEKTPDPVGYKAHRAFVVLKAQNDAAKIKLDKCAKMLDRLSREVEAQSAEREMIVTHKAINEIIQTALEGGELRINSDGFLEARLDSV